MRTDDVAVGIVTQDRVDDCVRALESVLRQDVPVRVIVFDNASRDGTSERLRSLFPTAEVVRSEESLGATGGRNQILAKLTTGYCFFMDDDSVLEAADVVRRSVAAFTHPRIAIVGVPIREFGRIVWGDPSVSDVVATQTFHGAAHCVRVDAVKAVGGYADRLFIYNEESDLSLRLLAAGWITAQVPGCEAVHRRNPSRDVIARRTRRWRNEVIFKYQYCPLHVLPLALCAQVRSMVRTWRAGRDVAETFRALGQGVAEWPSTRRTPVPRKVYRVWRRLGRAKRTAVLDAQHALESHELKGGGASS
jgi:GT2 family glycosyltransferase